ncbi:MAG: OmpA family protein [Cyclobacteriaceae bacterium]
MKSVVITVLILAMSCQGFSQSGVRLTPPHSAWDEMCPVLSPDGRELYFVMARHPLNTAGKKDPGDIWVTRNQNGVWSAPEPVSALNHGGYNAILGFGLSGNQVYLAGHYDGKRPGNGQGISVATRQGAGWSAPVPESIPYFSNRSSHTSGHVAAGGSVFLFAAESYGTEGQEDLYVCFRTETGWTEPRNLGKGINTPAQEVTPWLSADQRTLYFASNGRAGYGSFDVYFSQRLDDSWQQWSLPVNMGSRVNSEGREMFYHTFPEQGFALYMSTHNSDGYGEIRQHTPELVADSLIRSVPSRVNAVDTVVRIVPLVREKPLQAEEKLVRISGKVMDARSSQPLIASIHYRSDTLFAVNSGPDGLYALQIPSTSVYGVTVEAPGYIGNYEKLDIHTYEMKTLVMNFRLQPVEVGATVNLKNVLFQQSTSNLLEESSDELNMVVEFLKSNPHVEIELGGHTDNRGLHQHNLKLSRERVEKVKEYLVSHGISAGRISGKGYGGTRPIAENDAEDTRRLNRRVEFVILRK